MEPRKTLMIVRKPPFGSADSWEALRLALSFYAQRAPVAVVLEGPGVLNWVSGLVSEAGAALSVSRLVKDLGLFGVPVFIVSEDLLESGFDAANLASQHAVLIPRSRLAHMLTTYDSVVAV